MTNADEEFIDKMTDIVQRHLRVSYAMPIEDAHIAFEQVPSDFLNDDYCTVWREYNAALFECVRLLVRYEKALKAWEELCRDLEEDVRLTCLADYAYPTFRVACDIPLTFKEQLAKDVVKLEHLARGDRSLIEMDADERRAGYYYKEVDRLESEDSGLSQIRSCLTTDLYESDEAQHLQGMHGKLFHDASATLMSGKTTIASFSRGMYATVVEGPIDLKAELGVLDCHRARIQRGYRLFNDRAHALFDSLPR